MDYSFLGTGKWFPTKQILPSSLDYCKQNKLVVHTTELCIYYISLFKAAVGLSGVLSRIYAHELYNYYSVKSHSSQKKMSHPKMMKMKKKHPNTGIKSFAHTPNAPMILHTLCAVLTTEMPSFCINLKSTGE
jgi:hypothetical protein